MIQTERLVLRPWQDRDREPFAVMSADPAFRRNLGPTLSRIESDAIADRQFNAQREQGYCFWAVERRGEPGFIGYCGFKIAPAGIPGIENAIEIGWGFAPQSWGSGYASEAAQACLAWAWANLDTDRIIAITTPTNIRSQIVMGRIGMVRRKDLDFDHPALAAGDPLRPHVTFETLRP